VAGTVLIPFEDVDIELTFPDGSTETFTLEAPNGEGSDAYVLEFVPVPILPNYRDADIKLQKGYTVYQAKASLNYKSHRMNLFRLLAASNIALKIPPTFGDTNQYQTLNVMLENRKGIRNYLQGLPIAAAGQSTQEEADLIPAGEVTLDFKGKKPFNETEALQFNFGLGFDLPITPDTVINIYFDASGSMDTTLAPLQTMRDTLLKDALLPYYNNDGALYDQKVTVIDTWTDERTFEQMNNADPTVNPVRQIIFQDEASSVYCNNELPFNGQRTPTYETDITALRNNLENVWPANQFRGYVFHVDGGVDLNGYLSPPVFKELLQAIEAGTGNFAPPYGLSDRVEFTFTYDLQDGASAQYYLDKLLSVL